LSTKKECKISHISGGRASDKQGKLAKLLLNKDIEKHQQTTGYVKPLFYTESSPMAHAPPLSDVSYLYQHARGKIDVFVHLAKHTKFFFNKKLQSFSHKR